MVCYAVVCGGGMGFGSYLAYAVMIAILLTIIWYMTRKVA